MHLFVLKVQFYQQGDQERRLGLPISAFMDRENQTRLQFPLIFTNSYSCQMPKRVLSICSGTSCSSFPQFFGRGREHAYSFYLQ